MAVRVVHIRNVRMHVIQPLMVVPVRVRLSRGIIGPMHMLTVFVVHVPMYVLHGFMYVLVVMILGKCSQTLQLRYVANRQEAHRLLTGNRR